MTVKNESENKREGVIGWVRGGGGGWEGGERREKTGGMRVKKGTVEGGGLRFCVWYNLSMKEMVICYHTIFLLDNP